MIGEIVPWGDFPFLPCAVYNSLETMTGLKELAMTITGSNANYVQVGGPVKDSLSLAVAQSPRYAFFILSPRNKAESEHRAAAAAAAALLHSEQSIRGN